MPTTPTVATSDLTGATAGAEAFRNSANAAGISSPAPLGSSAATSQLIQNSTDLIQKAQQYTALSSNKQAQIDNTNSQLQSLTNGKGITVDENGIYKYADGSVVPNAQGVAGSNGSGQVGTWQQNPTTGIQELVPFGSAPSWTTAASTEVPKSARGVPLLPGSNEEDPTQTPEHFAAQNSYAELIARVDASSKAYIDSIQKQYESLISEMKDSNMRSQASMNTQLLQSGGYRALSSGSDLSALMDYGYKKVGDLINQESQAISQAQLAWEKQDFEIADAKIKESQAATDKRDKALQDIADKLTAAQKDARDFQAKQKQDAQDRQDKLTSEINNVALEAAKNGASPEVRAKISGAKTVGEAIAAAGDSLQSASGDLATYLFYKRDAEANGQTPESYEAWKAKNDAQALKLKGAEAYATGYGAAAGKAAAEAKYSSNSPTATIRSSTGATSGMSFNVPSSIAPYVNFSANGVRYLDVSSLQGTPTEKKQMVDDAQSVGIKILNKGQALDVQNITDASAKLENMRTDMTAVGPDSATARNTWQAASITAGKLLETNPEATSNDVYVIAALDILKAISGTQGFRGGTSIVDTVGKVFPTSTDTDAVINQKIDKIEKMMNDRQSALVGEPDTGTQNLIENKQATDKVNSYVADHQDLKENIATLYDSPGATDSSVYQYMQLHPEVYKGIK